MSEDDLTFLGFPRGTVEDVTKGTIGLIGSTIVSKSEHEPYGQERAAREIRRCSFEYTGYIDYLNKSIEEFDVIDLGDFGRDDLCKVVKGVLGNKGKAIVFGGDHTTTYYSLHCLKPDNLVVLDAHLDFADQTINREAESISHGFVNKLLSEKGWRIEIFGIRAYSSFPEEYQLAKDANARVIPWFGNEDKLVEMLVKSRYLSIDMDFFDASSFTATRVPELGGPTPREFIRALRSLSKLEVNYLDLVEYAPDLDATRVNCKIISMLIFELIAKIITK